MVGVAVRGGLRFRRGRDWTGLHRRSEHMAAPDRRAEDKPYYGDTPGAGGAADTPAGSHPKSPRGSPTDGGRGVTPRAELRVAQRRPGAVAPRSWGASHLADRGQSG